MSNAMEEVEHSSKIGWAQQIGRHRIFDEIDASHAHRARSLTG